MVLNNDNNNNIRFNTAQFVTNLFQSAKLHGLIQLDTASVSSTKWILSQVKVNTSHVNTPE